MRAPVKLAAHGFKSGLQKGMTSPLTFVPPCRNTFESYPSDEIAQRRDKKEKMARRPQVMLGEF